LLRKIQSMLFEKGGDGGRELRSIPGASRDNLSHH
jgi:hypothetical protein